MKQTHDLRSELGQKNQSLTLMTADLGDITVSVSSSSCCMALYIYLCYYLFLQDECLTLSLWCLQVKYGAVCSEREDMNKQVSRMQTEIQELREASERHLASDRVEVCVCERYSWSLIVMFLTP